MTVGLVVVSHSAALARGVCELAAAMAPAVPIVAAGGTGDGRLGTSFDLVSAALTAADRGDGVVLLYDLGSARMVAELVLETAIDPSRARLVDAPLVEGAVAAAVAAQIGRTLSGVVDAAAAAGQTWS